MLRIQLLVVSNEFLLVIFNTNDSLQQKLADRDRNLDFLRASAIVGVLVYHVASLWVPSNILLRSYLYLGRFGVDLFFVLSGWLIGGLYWREQKIYDDVERGRFWLRRALRTMPPYFVGLAIAYFGVWLSRSEPFQLSYLFFVQNYLVDITFFRASWSLCVEEHFYILFPFVGFFCTSGRKTIILLAALTIAAITSRFIDLAATPNAHFGYSSSATHLNLTGLSLGIVSSYTATFYPQTMDRVRSIAKVFAPLMCMLFLSLPFWSKNATYYIGDQLVAFFFTALLILVAGQKPFLIAKSRMIYFIAIASYSIYLTHSFVLNTALIVFRKITYIPARYRSDYRYWA